MNDLHGHTRNGMLNRFTDDLCVADIPPQTYGGLLNRLKLLGQPDHLKRRRVKRWLKHNEPSSNLRFFLLAEGYDVELPPYKDGTKRPMPDWIAAIRKERSRQDAMAA